MYLLFFFFLVAMPPEKIKIVNVEKKSVEIEWTEPAFLGEKIRGYKVNYSYILSQFQIRIFSASNTVITLNMNLLNIN